MAEDADVVVVGMGPGGEALPDELAEAGLLVVGIDARLVGGECPYYGCVPSKMMIRAADVLAEARRVPALAGVSTVSPDFTPVAARIRAKATDRLDDKPRRPVHLWGGRFICGRARIVARRTISVDGVEFTAHRALVLNSGTEPAIPPIPGLAETPFWSNRDCRSHRGARVTGRDRRRRDRPGVGPGVRATRLDRHGGRGQPGAVADGRTRSRRADRRCVNPRATRGRRACGSPRVSWGVSVDVQPPTSLRSNMAMELAGLVAPSSRTAIGLIAPTSSLGRWDACCPIWLKRGCDRLVRS
jgi:hypothetical protein